MRTTTAQGDPLSVGAGGRALVLAAVLAVAAACTEPGVDASDTDGPITILVGSGPGGVTDTSARIIAGFLENHLPGAPTVIVQNMPGGGSVTMANHLYRSAPRDGTVLGYSLPGIILAQLMEPERARYEGRELGWIGSAITATNMIVVLGDAPVDTLEQARDTEIIIGASGRGSPLYQLPALANELLDLQMRIITGYQGSSEITLAMERGEVHGQGAALDYWALARPEWLTNGQLKYLAYIGPPDARAPDAPHLAELVATERERQLIEVLEISSRVGWPLFAPPGVPPARLAALREAFSAVLNDPAFAEAIDTSMRTPVNPRPGAALQAIVEAELNTPESVIAEAKALLGI